ncbi:MAG: hypothetical protein WC117_00055 [Sphaerochaetaceae bacterium]|jgi:hypothetical protein
MDNTENNQTDVQDDLADALQMPSEIDVLKDRARMMGVPFSNNIGVEALRQRIADKLANTATEKESGLGEVAQANALTGEEPTVQEKKLTIRQYMVKEQTKLVRLRITNLDPKKASLPGEIFTVANEYLGTIRKFVPFGEVTDGGYHVPYCIYKMMDARKFLHIRTYKDRKNNNQIKVETSWAKEFALEVLPPLTKAELATLAATQAAAGGLA